MTNTPIICLMVGLCLGFSYQIGYKTAERDYQKELIVKLEEQANEINTKKDATINLLLSEGDNLKSDLDKSLGRLQQLTKRKPSIHNSTDPTRKSLERCRQFNLEGAELLRQALEGYRRESIRVDALNETYK